MKQFDWSLIERVRSTHPLVLIINNAVTPQIVANAVNFIGASPMMITAPEEASDMVAQADAICLNIGTLNQAQQELMTTILAANQAFHRPVVFDPVAVGSSSFRLNWTKQVLDRYPVTCLRGNAGEMAALLHRPWHSHGIDSGEGQDNVSELVQECARHFHSFALASGPTDYVSDGIDVEESTFTNPYFPRYVGTGDMLSALVATFLAVENSLQAVLTAVGTFTLCGQSCHDRGPHAWFNHFNDVLSEITTVEITKLFEKSEHND
ncbi:MULTISPECIES: hydroxyethylthiazole kinase [Lactobacillaceae]|uniref:hydroxyethylthiazole kinase n=1 Tax=Lactobacillaceae TaxID=33958 RepID=UPI00243244F3|nr:hydroxyethylthiazole kinase [Ligilactobacillus saerimneri]